MSNAYDTTRRTLAQAGRMPQWRRLMSAVNAAQAAKGWPSRHFSAEDARAFGETYIGKPWEKVGRGYAPKPEDFAVYWVVRQEFEHSDGSTDVVYKLKAVYGDDLATVHTIAASEFGAESINPTPEWEEATALDFIRRAEFQGGKSA